MPATHVHEAPSTFRCYRCGKEKSTSEFYHRADGSIISGCKDCHRAISAARSAKRAQASTALPLGIVENAAPAPALIQYRCEGCGRSAMSAAPEGPRGWKRVRLANGEDPATLCPRCTAGVTRAMAVMQNVAQRRAGGRGRSH